MTKKKIKICHLLTSYFGGGVESSAKTFTYHSSDKYIFNVYFVKNIKKKFH